jgi:hypothetical protein
MKSVGVFVRMALSMKGGATRQRSMEQAAASLIVQAVHIGGNGKTANGESLSHWRILPEKWRKGCIQQVPAAFNWDGPVFLDGLAEQ